jgi:hypothetical protein
MGKKRLSRDQVRKAKLAERARKNLKHQPESLAYTGNTYKKDEYLPIVLSTETGIGEADAVSHKRLTDRHVREALEEMVLAMRDGSLPDYDPSAPLRYVAGEEPALVQLMIRRNWSMLFEGFPHPGKDVLVGILRTLLNSINTFTTPAPGSRGYLTFLAGFLKKAGVRIQLRTEEGVIDDEGPADPLIELGETWLEYQSVQARRDFYELAGKLVDAGQGERVAEAAQYLAGQSGGGPMAKELAMISILAQSGKRPQLPG